MAAVREEMQKLLAEFVPSQPKKPTVFLHLGVHGGAKCFNLENTAWNEADFRCPDERGCTPTKTPIKNKNELCHCYQTALPLNDIYETLSAKGYKCVISFDAGRFLCNFIYYLSLHKSNINGTYSLFLHVPPFEEVGKEDQLAFIKCLIEEITKALLT